MPLNTNIPLSVRTPQPITPEQAAATGFQLRGAKRAEDQAIQNQRDQQTIQDLYRQNVGADGSINQAGFEHGVAAAGLGDQLPKIQQASLANQKTQADTQASQFKLAKERTDAVAGGLSSLLANPQVTHQDVYAKLNELVQGGVITADQGAAAARGLPGRPEQLRPFLIQQAMQAADASKRLEALLPKTSTIDAGDRVEVGTVDPMTGQRTVNERVQKGVNPSAAVMGGGQRTKPPSGYQWTPDGNLAPIVGGPADLSARPKNLRAVPPAVATGVISNRQEIGKVDRALAALEANPDAFGMQNYLPDALTQRVDSRGMKGGVDARAKVADISSMIIHDRSGAAVSASEFPRLAPFIPQKTDDPATVKVKLQNLKATLEAMNEETEGAYTEDAGYRPIGSAQSDPIAQPSTSDAGVPPDIAALLAKHGSK